MIRLILLLLLAGLFAAGIAWLADRPGEFLFTFGSYQMRTSVGIAIGMLIGVVVLLFLIIQIIAMLWRTPGVFGRWISARRARMGYEALSQGLVAAAAGDAVEAKRLARQSEALLGSPPLALLLSAQSAQLDGDDARQTATLKKMLDHPNTEFLGLRGLFLQAMRREDATAAMAHAARAHVLKPKAAWATNALFDLHVRQSDWTDAQKILDQQQRQKLLDADVVRRRRAVLLAARAVEDEARGDKEAALDHAQEALALAPGLTRAAIIAAKRLSEAGRFGKAQDVIEAAWASDPQADLAKAYAAIRTDEDPLKRARRLRSLAERNPADFESKVLFAEQAVAEKQWDRARAILAPLSEIMPTARVCTLMAALEKGERNDAIAEHQWLARAARAIGDAQWACSHCGWTGAEWNAVCKNCGAFDSLIWKRPEMGKVERLVG